MAWTTLINALFLPGKKILGSTGMALRDNIIAVLMGDTTAHAADMVIRAAAMRGVAAGSEVALTVLGSLADSFSRTNAGSGNFTSGPTKVGMAVTALRAGTVTVSAQLRRTVTGTGASGTFQLDVYKNGTSVLTLTATGTTYSTFTGDVTFAAGDVIEFAFSTSGSTAAGGGSMTADIRQVKCLADVASFWCI